MYFRKQRLPESATHDVKTLLKRNAIKILKWFWGYEIDDRR
jgi:hypothetical protein